MTIYETKNRDYEIIDKLYILWEKSVRATHLFLKEDDIINISKYVKKYLIDIKHLIIAEIEDNIVGFMGTENKKLEMLFLDPEAIGNGIGKELIKYAIENYDIKEVSVNEQNTNAYNFYKHMGFKDYKRDEYDDLGNNFPIIHMRII
ncbi:GNAT family N-acetyltransferase [Brachyspira hyodysenteriae]|uniref:GNAT family N-acetyltransferase n=2 Tax=Brachyspira hyodysenteriae TaxID=159 RepID=A0A3B6VZN6_BRAHO|nr:GNAT family N-acetyltransferase [Brachyspira hyodysenteriae]ANN62949.1 GNAT family N-acetyltransferase [Brachyspira hyodysenteriae ATCC 27164]AUJ50736.1 acetyltransferase [Brachyspira hyodysenteriae]KLI13526.1 acetyltransferase [Brachyspira hyodysenteriae]KLI17924.1 acetyltransferase [Brachyspira hyodysenteriae]KLI19658.1 acetyltransferase [Brachyspira hyodysenteriae]